MYLDSWQLLTMIEGCPDYLVRDISHSFWSGELVVRLSTLQIRDAEPFGSSLSVPAPHLQSVSGH